MSLEDMGARFDKLADKVEGLAPSSASAMRRIADRANEVPGKSEWMELRGTDQFVGLISDIRKAARNGEYCLDVTWHQGDKDEDKTIKALNYLGYESDTSSYGSLVIAWSEQTTPSKPEESI